MRENLSLGKKIRIMRIVRGIEQDEFARLVGTTYQTVSGWENDRHIPHDRNMERIKAVLRWPEEKQADIAFTILAGDGVNDDY